ncbi:glycosyltransferase family 4 protein [Gottfriedia acidiceleris]|uniref:glycosyltransferase family 4 protein n=1 Tax=Gottfriedia acidiceleris TaxID=371036 RepID=UPI00142FB428|nr:glycosyltransferase family 4 protein [Gottfriedia acidiceleris]
MKVAIIQGSVSPYRVDLFNFLVKNFSYKYEFIVLYAAKPKAFDRNWTIDEKNMLNSHFLKSKAIKIKIGKFNKYTNLPIGVQSKLNEINPDIVIGAEYNPSTLLGYLWAKKHNKKYISWSDGTLQSEKNINPISKKVRQIICSNSDALIASSTQTKEAQRFYGANSNKIFISYLTVDLEKYIIKNKRNNTNNLLYVGRLIKLKGLDLLFRAISKIEKEYTLTIVGEGEEKEKLINLCKELQIDQKVSFLGYKEGKELRELYANADLFIFPSLNDCFGLVLIEALCAELPLLTSKYAGASYDVIKDNGYIYDPYDQDNFLRKLRDIIDNKENIDQKRFNSLELVNKFSFNNVSKEFIKAIESVSI